MMLARSPRSGSLGSPRHQGALSPRADWGRRSRSSSRRQVCPWAFKEGEAEPRQQHKDQQPQRGAAVGGPAGSAPPGSGPCASVTFKACHRVAFGQILKVVGDLPQLGAWDCEQAPGELRDARYCTAKSDVLWQLPIFGDPPTFRDGCWQGYC
ncbi:hypothetical protein ABPG77_004209 [Micractinium sp. CCAP 211/92]